MARAVDDEELRNVFESYLEAARKGFRVDGRPPSAAAAAAEAYGKHPAWIRHRLDLARQRLGLTVPEDVRRQQLAAATPTEALPDLQVEPLTDQLAEQLAVCRAEARTLRAQLERLRSEEMTREAVRRHIFGIRDYRPEPPVWLTRRPAGRRVLGVPTLFLSDWQMGEVIKPAEVNHFTATRRSSRGTSLSPTGSVTSRATSSNTCRAGRPRAGLKICARRGTTSTS